MGYGGATSLHSINASGQINKEYVYYVVKGVQRRRAYFIPTNPQTLSQQAKRIFFKNGMEYWGNLPDIEKQKYNDKAKIIKTGWIGYNYFMRLWLRGEIVSEVIKSVQSNIDGLNDGNNDITINAVEASKSVFKIQNSSYQIADGYDNVFVVLGGRLTSSTNLRIRAIVGANITNARVGWQVVEYY